MPTRPDDILLNKAAIHEYQKLDKEILHYIAQQGSQAFTQRCTALNLNIKG